MSKPGEGRFVWYDLMTSDVEAAQSFYKEVIGWSTIPFDGGGKPYEMWAVGDQPIGGAMILADEAKAMGAPPHWLAYVSVPDADKTAQRAAELGGRVLAQPWDIPTVGRVAILQDPQQAVFAVFTPVGDMPMHEGKARSGDFSWHELNTTDWEKAWEFYSALFGWKNTESVDMGPEVGTYYMFQRSDADTEGSSGGMCNTAEQTKSHPHWLYYVTVGDLDKAVESAKSRGGELLNGPMEVPGGDRIAQLMDPQGAAFALHEAAKN